ncbi:unnamed protein product, partial [Ectocarpus sp. 4 AP-2014]
MLRESIAIVREFGQASRLPTNRGSPEAATRYGSPLCPQLGGEDAGREGCSLTIYCCAGVYLASYASRCLSKCPLLLTENIPAPRGHFQKLPVLPRHQQQFQFHWLLHRVATVSVVSLIGRGAPE